MKSKTITVQMPKGYMNLAVVNDQNCQRLRADTNYSKDWDVMSLPLPYGKWSIYKVDGKLVTLRRKNLWNAILDAFK